MKPSPWQFFLLLLWPFLFLAELIVLLKILMPAVEANNPRWVVVDFLALFTTTGVGHWHFNRVCGQYLPPKSKPDWQRMKQFSYWYGGLGYIWFALQMVFAFQITTQVIGPHGFAWKIAQGAETIVTFWALIWWINRKLGPDRPRNMGTVLWPSYTLMLFYFATIFLPSWPPTGPNPFSVENWHMGPEGIKTLCFTALMVGGLVFYGIREKRAEGISS